MQLNHGHDGCLGKSKMEYNRDQINMKDVRTRSDIFLDYYRSHSKRLTMKNVRYVADWLDANGGAAPFTDKKGLKLLIINSVFNILKGGSK